MTTVLQVESSTEYSKFDTFIANRDVSRQHINELKIAMRDNPDVMKVQPILVNENFRIIDGQHRFHAAKELGLPIYYTVLPGGTMQLARDMNNVQRSWAPLDWAKSYATEGDVDYQQYLTLRAEYPHYGHSIILLCISLGEKEGIHKQFRYGKLEIADLMETRYRLNFIDKIDQILDMRMNGRLVRTLNIVLNNQKVDRDRLLHKVQLAGNKFLKPAANQQGYLRAIEEIYNYNVTDDKKLRLF